MRDKLVRLNRRRYNEITHKFQHDNQIFCLQSEAPIRRQLSLYRCFFIGRGRKYIKYVLFTLLTAIVTTLMAIVAVQGFDQKVQLVVWMDGKGIAVETKPKTVGELFDESEWIIGPHDQLSVPLDHVLRQGDEIIWNQAKQVMLHTRDGKEKKWTSSATVEGALREWQLPSPGLHDVLSPKSDIPIREGMTITYHQSFSVSIHVDGKKLTKETAPSTVQEIIDGLGIILRDRDYTVPTLTAEVLNERDIVVHRVAEGHEVEQEVIPYKTIEEKDPNVLLGIRELKIKGVEGIKVREYELLKHDGAVVDRQIKTEKVLQEVVDEIYVIGTKEPEPEPDPEPNLVEESALATYLPSQAAETSEHQPKKTFSIMSTAYTRDCEGCIGITKMGIDLNKNPDQKVIAVDPDVIPLGTKVYVEGYGEAIAADTGGAIKGMLIDVYMQSHEEAIRWGRRPVQLTILE